MLLIMFICELSLFTNNNELFDDIDLEVLPWLSGEFSVQLNLDNLELFVYAPITYSKSIFFQGNNLSL